METYMFHSASFLIAFILFLITFFRMKGGNEGSGKIAHMILRIFFLLIIITGGIMGFSAFEAAPLKYVLKMLGGLILIGILEMILSKARKRENTAALWLLLIIILAIVVYLGYSLPLGYRFF